MGLRENFEITNYNLPARLTFNYDGVEISSLRANFHLVNFEGKEVRRIQVLVPLTAGQKSTLQGVLETKLAAFEATNGWPLYVPPPPP